MRPTPRSAGGGAQVVGAFVAAGADVTEAGVDEQVRAAGKLTSGAGELVERAEAAVTRSSVNGGDCVADGSCTAAVTAGGGAAKW